MDAIWQWITGELSAIWQHMQAVWQWIYHHIIQVLIQIGLAWYLFIRYLLTQWIIPIISQLLKWYQKYIGNYLLVAQQIISQLRAAINALKLLGVQWAAKFDADLQLVQGYLSEVNQLVYGTLNSFSTLFGLVLDPTGIFNPTTWAKSVFANPFTIINAAALPSNIPMTAAQTATQQANVGLMNPATPPVSAGPNGTVSLSPTMQDIQSKLDAALPIYNTTVQ